ncbi:lymphocyte activation gene 3 protein-like isoform X1 [Polypterus senegalus]|uniref:lymphocyte activation gene 3 protein-like isoform X1 n=2 Tax=Polypterus senegalus TaxID=55291 RepID=UPI0019645B07|nr:lymphocyte activation gene 3 protein-like isoform X1 [Polypterus senegalus]
MFHILCCLFGTLHLLHVCEASTDYDVFYEKGSTAILPCYRLPSKSTVNRMAVVQWLKVNEDSSDKTIWRVDKSGLEYWSNNILKRAQAHQAHFHKGDYSLSIDHLGEDDAGQYKCRVKYGHQEFKVTVNLHILQAVPTEKSKPLEGRSWNMKCIISDKPETVTVRWFHNGKPVQESDRISIKNSDATLTIHNLEPTESGNWTCQVVSNNQTGSASALLQVHGFAEPTSKTTTVYAAIGAPVYLPCILSSGVQPMKTGWQWKPSGSIQIQELKSRQHSISIAESKDQSNVSLFLPAVEFKKAGEYICFAEMDTLRFHRIVKLVTAQVIVKVSHSAKDGSLATFSITLSEESGVERYEWVKIKKDSNYTNSSDHTLAPEKLGPYFGKTVSISLLSEEFAGEWVCNLYSKEALLGQIPVHLLLTGMLQGSKSESSKNVPMILIFICIFIGFLFITLIVYRYRRRRARNALFPALESVEKSIPSNKKLSEKNCSQKCKGGLN